MKGIKTLSALAACDDGESRIIWHWQFGEVVEDAKYPVRGFTLFNVERDDGPGEFKVKEINIEFDSIPKVEDIQSRKCILEQTIAYR